MGQKESRTMKKFKCFIVENDYKIDHESPDPESGAPMHDLTQNGIYPEDVYGIRGFDYHNHSDKKDYDSHHKVMNLKGKPYNRVRIYRAVPKDKNIKEINKGDWVTHNRDYAVEHGRANIGIGKWKIISKTARARELFTDGSSIHEWGYHPQPADEGQITHDKIRQEKIAKKHEEMSKQIKNISGNIDALIAKIKDQLK